MLRLAVPFLLCLQLAAADPAWVGATNLADVPGYPPDRWLVGIGQQNLKETDAETARKRALDGARAELAQSIRAHVQSTTVHTVFETSGASARFQERFALDSTITTSLDVSGLHTEVCARADAIFALAAVERSVMAAAYLDRAHAAATDASSRAATARSLEQAGRHAEALDAWAQVVAPASLTAEHLSLMRVLGGTPDPATEQTQRDLRAEAGAALARLEARPVATVDDLADILARRLRGQSTETPAILVTPLTLRGTRVPSPFGRLVAARVSAALGRRAWPVVSPPDQGNGTTRERAATAGAHAVLLGSVWPQADGSAQVIIEVVALASGTRLGTAEARLPQAGIAATGDPLEPENAAVALASQQAFSTNEVLSQGLKVELWTNKGSDAQVFTEGETMQVFVRVDRPCHVRLIYHLATGEQVLLLDDRLLDDAKVNRPYELPEKFECSAPFGAEVLQANASSEPFRPLTVVIKDGYHVITEGLDAQLVKTRGMIKKTEPVQLAEAQVVLTSMPKPRK